MEVNRIYQHNVMEGWPLTDQSVHCIVTSPPYWGLRDYGVEGQLGLEKTPEEFIENMVKVFREAKRVLKDDGTLWVNIGDSYASVDKWGGSSGGKHAKGLHGQSGIGRAKREYGELKPKDLVGIPWMLAFALRSDGWYLRQDIIWHKPNPMPESVIDRCTKAHEYIFHFSKNQKYFFDSNAIKTPSIRSGEKSYHDFNNKKYEAILHDRWKDQFDGRNWGGGGVANKRSVWEIPTNSFKGAHFATFPVELPALCIKAGCPTDGLVLDPFIGAGTTAVAARKLNRNFIGLELNPDYIAIAERRLQKELGLFY
jgi:DNA modification methylase